MGCCGSRKKVNKPWDIMGGYKYLEPHQIRARLEAFKRKYCTGCEKRYDCDFKMYTECKKYKIDI